ncbi:squalene/phytoene synthase family protein [Candidatus Methylospira mobilis]|uniref:Squalene/phytoene synthase family protein n=1 Tax=Candidatus Methylospira mobilis TaxID=1808979 RepID=A0A5Q0BLX9_9GAMM|nr:phytoene/squalene synthase family protein [Candidatus Methylospira mobilis]QFY44770.1 squalene/phytoene synthase family protein [Candidatus Methylospira mobilis]WNV05689.1 phytoene/squalene synthase family protein [Candidatus Methylospira mobilis]
MSKNRSGVLIPCQNELGDDALQSWLLEGVSRTFALTIPRLPEGLAKPVSNAYLLCRIVDTIEDEVSLDNLQKRRFCQQFTRVVAGDDDPAALASELAPLLSAQTISAEHELIRLIPRVIAITHGFDAPQREALSECVRIMGTGMAEFQDRDLRYGVETLAEMNRYCYFVAGVVGEMLTRLFCHYSPEIAAHRERMMELAVSFGQGLQMTNILKDLWDDHARGVCWLPREIFDAAGFDLKHLKPHHNNPRFREGFVQLIGIAHAHLRNALEYTLLIPVHESGMREFCLWALGMAVLTLRKVNGNLDFSESSQVKITRASVKATILTTRVTRSSDTLLKLAFTLAGARLPMASTETARVGSQQV